MRLFKLLYKQNHIYHLIQMANVVLIVLLLFGLFITSQAAVNSINDITEYTVNNHWDEVANLLNSLQSFDSIEGLTEESLHKILTLSLPKLQNLSFGQTQNPWELMDYFHQRQTQVLTHKLVKDVFTSQYFPNLKVLNLQGTNLDDRSFAFLEDNSTVTSSLQTLKLANNYIGALGLRRLSRIHFTGLTNLNFNGNLLIQNSAVDGLIQIICQKDTDICQNQIEQLSIANTHINRDGFIQLISKTNRTTLKKLDMDEMSFKFKQTLKEGFNYSAYEYLAQQSFPALEVLSMSYQINDDIGNIFKDWQLPSLKRIQISLSPIGNQGVISWVTKRNMPNLQYLQLYGTNIGDDCLLHLVNQSFDLSFFNIGATKISNEGILLCSKLSTHLFKTFILKDLKLKSQYLQQLLVQINLSNLQYLSLTNNKQISDLFEYFPWQKLQNLKGMKLSGCDFSDSYQNLLQNVQMLLPNLEFLIMEDTNKNMDVLNSMILALPIFFPNLLYATIGESYQFAPISWDMLSQSLTFYKVGAEINFGWVWLKKGESKFQIISLASLALLQALESAQPQNIVQRRFLSLFDISQIEVLNSNSMPELSAFLRLLSKAKVSSLSKLRRLGFSYIVQAEDFVASLSDLSFPFLNLISCALTVAADLDTTFLEEIMIPFFQTFFHLQTFQVLITYLNEDEIREQQKLFLDNLNYPFLKGMFLQTGQMQAAQVNQFIKIHTDTLRTIYAGGNFFQKGFFTMLADYQITLEHLAVSQTFFTPKQFAAFGTIHTEFLTYLDLSSTDLTNQHIVAMMEQKQKGPYFPKLVEFDLSGNDIREQGLRLLMKTGLYSLKGLFMQYNSNPQFINILLNYPCQIWIILAEKVQIYSLQNDLNPESVNGVNQLSLSAESFTKQDFSNLARLSFNRLSQSSLQITNVYDCEVLMDLLKINQWAQIAEITFINDNEGLNSSCLANMNNYTSQIESINIVDEYVTTFIPEFIQIMLNSERDIRHLILQNTRLPPATLSKIFKKNLHSIQKIALRTAYLDDSVFSQLLQSSNFLHLSVLEITSTQITDESIRMLSKLVMPSLSYLQLSSNNLGPDAIAFLADFNAPQLGQLDLQSCELDIVSLGLINYLKFPGLQFLDLSYNNFSEQDILQFVAGISRQIFPSLQTLNLKGVSMSQKNYDALEEILSNKNILGDLSPPYNMKPSNSASY